MTAAVALADTPGHDPGFAILHMNTLPPTPVAALLRLLGLALAVGLAASVTLAAPTVGEQIRLSATMVDGGRVSLDDAGGRRALLVLWSPASLAWRKSMGELERFAASPEGSAVYLLSVSIDGDAASLRQFMAARGARLPVALRGEDNLGPLEEHRLPLLLVIDAEGRLLRHHTGMFTARTLRELLEPPTLR